MGRGERVLRCAALTHPLARAALQAASGCRANARLLSDFAFSRSLLLSFLSFLPLPQDSEIESYEEASSSLPSFSSPSRERPPVLSAIGRPASVFAPPAAEVTVRDAGRYKKRRAPRPPTFAAASPDDLDDQLGCQSAAGLSQSVPAFGSSGLVPVELELEPPERPSGPAKEAAPEQSTEARRQHHSSVSVRACVRAFCDWLLDQ